MRVKSPTACSIRDVSTFSGLPAHPLLVHFVVVLAPLTAILAILCALWPAGRRRFVWLVAALAGVTAVLTPITAEAGEWLYERTPDSPFLETHEHLGETMIYVAIGLVVAAALLVFLHVRTQREKHSAVLSAIVAAAVVVIGIAAMIQTYRVGDSGARSVWNEVSTTAPAEGG